MNGKIADVLDDWDQFIVNNPQTVGNLRSTEEPPNLDATHMMVKSFVET
jgi:hypothetical protein